MRILALVLATGLGACSATEPVDPDVRLGLQLDRTTVVRGDSVRLSLTLTNTSARTIKVLPAKSKSQEDAIADLTAHDTELKAVTAEVHKLEDDVEQAKAELVKFLADTVIE